MAFNLKNFLQAQLDKTDLDEKVVNAIRQPRQQYVSPMQRAPNQIQPPKRISGEMLSNAKTNVDWFADRLKPSAIRSQAISSVRNNFPINPQGGPLGNVRQNNTVTPMTPGKVSLPNMVNNYIEPKKRLTLKDNVRGFKESVIDDPIYDYDPSKTGNPGYAFGVLAFNNPAVDQLTMGGSAGVRTGARITAKNSPKVLNRVMDIAIALKDAKKIREALKGDNEAIRVMENLFNDKRFILDSWEDVAARGRKLAELDGTEDIAKNFDEAEDIRSVGDGYIKTSTGIKNTAKADFEIAGNPTTKKALKLIDEPPNEFGYGRQVRDFANDFVGNIKNQDGGFINFGAKVSLKGDELADTTEGLYQIFRKAPTPEEAIGAIDELSQLAARNGDTALYQALKKAAQQYKSDLVTGRGLPRNPENAGVIKALDEVLGKTIKTIKKEAKVTNVPSGGNKVVTAPKGSTSVVKTTKPITVKAPTTTSRTMDATTDSFTVGKKPQATSTQDLNRFNKMVVGGEDAQRAANSTRKIVSKIKPDAQAGLYDTKNIAYRGTPDVKGGIPRPSKRGDLGEGIYLARDKKIAERFSDSSFRNSALEPKTKNTYIDINTGKTIKTPNAGVQQFDINKLKIKKITPEEWSREVEKLRSQPSNSLPKNYQEIVQRKWIKQGYDGLEISGTPRGDSDQILVFTNARDKLRVAEQPVTDIGKAITESKSGNTFMEAAPNNVKVKQVKTPQGPQQKVDFEMPKMSVMDRFIETFQNNMKRQVKLNNAEGINLTEANDVNLAEVLFHGRRGSRLEEAQKEMDVVVDNTRKLAEKSKKTKEAFKKDVNDYLQARHAPERNAVRGDGAAGMTNAEAKATLARLNKDKNVVKVANELQDMNNQTLDLLYQSGIVDKATYTKLRSTYKNHVPLNRIQDETYDIAQVLDGAGMDVKSTGLKTSKGSDKEVADIYGNILTNLEQAITKSEKNIYDNTVLKFARDNKHTGLFEELKPKAIGKSFDEQSAIMQTVNDPNVLVLREKGKLVYLKINDPKLAEMYKGVNKDSIPGLLNYVGAFTRYMASINTRFNPEFAPSNIVRDMQEMAVYMSAQDNVGFNGAAKAVSKTGGSIKDVTDAIRGADTPGAKLYKQMRLDGGTTGGYGLSTRKQVELNLAKTEAIADSNPRKAAHKLLEAADSWNQIFEDSTRLSVYKAALEKGHSRRVAASMAKEATVNFNRKGTAGPIVNAVWMFSNASIQGSAKMLKAMKNPKVAAATIGSVGSATFAANKWNDGVDPNWRDKVSDWDRSSNLVIVLPTENGAKYITIPVSWGLKPIKAGADVSYDIISGNSQGLRENIATMADAFINAYNPLGGSGVSTLVPTAIKTPVEIWANRGWYGGDIKPYWKRSEPGSKQYYDDTGDSLSGKIAIKSAEKFAPVYEVSPESILYGYQQYVGGSGRFLTRIANTGTTLAQGELPEATNVPFTNRFYKSKSEERVNQMVNSAKQKEAKKNATSGKGFTISSGDSNAVVGEDSLTWYDAEGDSHKLALKPETGDGGISQYHNSDWYEKQAIKVHKAQIPDEQKEAILKEWGFTLEEARYADLASYNEDVSVQHILAKSPNHEKLIDNLTTGRVVSIAGEQFASNGVLKRLYEAGEISYGEYQSLKALKTDKTGKQLPGTSKAKKPKKLSLPKPKKASVAKIASTRGSRKIPQIKVIKPPTIKSGSSSNGTNTYKIATFKPKNTLTIKYSKKPSLTG